MSENIELNNEFTLSELMEGIKRLKNKTPGIDQIHNIFIKKAPLSLLKNILNLFNKSYDSKTATSNLQRISGRVLVAK